MLVSYSNILDIFFLERFDHLIRQENEFESINFEMFENVVDNFGKSNDSMI